MTVGAWIPSEADFQAVRGNVGNRVAATKCENCSCSCTACDSCRCTPCHRASGTRISLRR